MSSESHETSAESITINAEVRSVAGLMLAECLRLEQEQQLYEDTVLPASESWLGSGYWLLPYLP